MESMSLFQMIGYIIYVLLIISTVLVVISENRNPIRTLSWILVLMLLPGVGLVLFYFFGQDTRRMKHISIKYYKRIKDVNPGNKEVVESEKILPEFSTLITLLEHTNYSPVLYGSEVEVITTGERKFSSLLEDMENARHHIHIEYFIFNNDETGRKVKSMLMKKASEGVEVRFLYDNVANWAVPKKFYNEMKDAGVEVASFMKVSLPALRSKVNYRNHRKIVVIDGQIGYVGGMNVGDEYALDPSWRDTHLRMVGKGTHGLQSNFLIDWYSSGEKRIEDKIYFPPCETMTENQMQIVTGGPISSFRNLLQATISIIIQARTYIYIQTPYFLPTESLFQALQTAALSGVDVRLMVSKKSDSVYVDPAARSYYEDLLSCGLRIYELQDQFVHAKTMVADDKISVIGSANMDFRSFESNFEINCYLYDPALARRNKEIFFEDLAGCREVLLKEWRNRSSWKRLLESVMRLIAPLM